MTENMLMKRITERGYDPLKIYTKVDPNYETVLWVYTEEDDTYIGQYDTDDKDWID